MTDPEPIIPKAPPAEDRLGIRRRLARAFEEIRGADEAGCQAIIDHDD